MKFKSVLGVPEYEIYEYKPKDKDYCLLIPVLNEGEKIKNELIKAVENNVSDLVDIIICDGNSKDNSVNDELLQELKVNTKLIKIGSGKLSAQLRMGFDYALARGYKGIITVDGNNKDSIEDVYKFIDKLEEGYDFIQGSRFIENGKGVNTPKLRDLAIRLIHAPITSLGAKERFTDTTNGYRGFSRKYLTHNDVLIFRDIFDTYELLAYLSTRASQLNLKTIEVPVTRVYPKEGPTPTHISPIKGNINLFKILLKNFKGDYNPK